MVDRGMFPHDAETVFNLIKDAPENQTMINRWNDPIDGYPTMMQGICLLSIKSIAGDWIEEHMPKAWFKALFI